MWQSGAKLYIHKKLAPFLRTSFNHSHTLAAYTRPCLLAIQPERGARWPMVTVKQEIERRKANINKATRQAMDSGGMEEPD